MKRISVDFVNKVVCVMTKDLQETQIEPELIKEKFIEQGFIPQKYCEHTCFTWNFDNDTFAVNQDHKLQDGVNMNENCFLPECIIPFKGLSRRLKEFLSVLNYEKIDANSLFTEEIRWLFGL